jgi:hypothetical protein
MENLPCGKNLHYEIHENLPGGELCADQATSAWPLSQCKGPLVKGDLKGCFLLEPRYEIHPEKFPVGIPKSLGGFRMMLAGGECVAW